MDQKKPDFSITSHFFIALLLCGAVIVMLSFFVGRTGSFFNGLLQIGFGVLLIGVGEWINHPLQQSRGMRSLAKENFAFHRFFHRKRNPSSIGNLFAIAGLLLFFTGIAYFL